MFGNWVVDEAIIAGGPAPTRQQVNLINNELVGGVANWVDNQTPVDLRFNSWKGGHPDPLAGCYDTNATYVPAIDYGYAGVSCSEMKPFFKLGYFTLVTPFVSGVEMPKTGLGSYTTANERLPQMPLEQTFGVQCNCLRGVQAQMLRADPVNSATGSFTETVTDAQLGGAGNPFRMTRTYNSLDTRTGPFGDGWTFAFNASLWTDPVTGNVTIRAEDGQQGIYRKEPNGDFFPPPGIVAKLTSSTSGYRLTRPEGTYLDFDTQGRLTAMKDQVDQGLSMAYASGKLATVSDPAGRIVTFTFTDSRITKVALPDGRHVDYTYTAGRLTSVTDLRGKITTYAYDANQLLKSGQDPNGNWLFRNTYDDQTGRLLSQLDARGNKTDFEWDSAQQIATTIDARGSRWIDRYDNRVLISQTDPLGHTTDYGFYPMLNLTRVTDARDNTTTMGYDAAGNMTSRTAPAPLSYVESWTYTPFNAIKTYTDGRGQTTTYEYFTDTHQLKTEADPLDRVTAYTYTAQGQVDTVTDPRGNVTDYDYDAAGNPIKVTTPEGSVTTFANDGSGRRTATVDPRGNASGASPADYTTTLAYNDTDAVTSAADARGRTTTMTYDDAGNLDTITDPSNKITDIDYYADNKLKSVTDPRGAVLQRNYDANGNLTEAITPAGTTSFEYDAANRRTTEVTPRGNAAGASATDFTWDYNYDPAGNLKSKSHPTAGTVAYDYDNLNRVSKITDPLGSQTLLTRTYNADIDRLTVTESFGKVTTFNYDDVGQLDRVTDANGRITDYGYDASGHRISVRTPLGNEWKWVYDGNGRLATEIDPRGQAAGATPADFAVKYQYDPAGQLTQVTRPLDRSTTYAYDAVGNLTARTDGNNHTKNYTYTNLDQLRSVTGPANTGITTYDYDDSGNLHARTDAKNRTTTFEHDLVGRLTQKATPIGTWNFVYDPEGNRTKTVTPAGNETTGDASDGTISRTYDPANRLTHVDYSDSTPDVTFDYNELYPTSTLEAGATDPETYTHDTLGQLKTVARGTSRFTYDYDERGNITKRTHPDGTVVNQTWDDDGRALTTTGNPGTANQVTATYGYDPAGHITTVTRENDTVDTVAYDETGWPTSVDAKKGATIIANHVYTYDKVGNPLTARHTWNANLIPTVTTEAYTYDDASRVSKVCYTANCSNRSEYNYDNVGNRLTENRVGGTKAGLVTLTYNAKDQLTRTSRPNGLLPEVIDFTYDANGNRSRAGARTYTYDLADRPTRTVNGTTTTAYAYDGNGNRTSSTTGTAKTTLTWDQNFPLPELAAETTGTLTQTFVNDPAGTPIATIVPGTSGSVGPQYLHSDPLGNIQAATDKTGARKATYGYEPFGTARTSPTNQSALDNPTRFAGEYQDPTTALYNLRARDYDPTTGRFDGLDPVAQDVGDPYVSEYLYANNQPTVLTDPSGRCLMLCTALIGGGVGGVIGGAYYAATTDDFTLGGLASATGKGGAVGFVAGATGYAGSTFFEGKLTSTLAGGTVGGFASSFPASALNGEGLPSLQEALAMAGFGALTAGAGYGIGRVVCSLRGAASPAGAAAANAGRGALNLPFKNPALRTQVDDVVRHFDEFGAPPPGVAQGGLKGYPKGTYGNKNGALPGQPVGHYTESDIWTSGGSVKRGAERLIFGDGGEVYYTYNHYELGSFVRIR
jgi:RHS repeat-associated protein